jgi:predicted Ser/Thr protein kinase
METIYSSKRTTIILTADNRIIKTVIRPINEKEYENQILASKLGIAPNIYSSNFDNYSKKLTIEMEYIDGIFLDNYLKQPNIDKKRVKRILFTAINKLYNNGINHKDISNKNIIIVTKDGKIDVKILDYGDSIVYEEPIQFRLRDYSIFNNKNW